MVADVAAENGIGMGQQKTQQKAVAEADSRRWQQKAQQKAAAEADSRRWQQKMAAKARRKMAVNGISSKSMQCWQETK